MFKRRPRENTLDTNRKKEIQTVLPWTSRRLQSSFLSILSDIICLTPIQYIPVHIRHGPATGAKWTFLPYSHYWLQGGEWFITAALKKMSGRFRAGSCWDFGAHFGIYTVGLAMEVGNKGQVAAFEPNPVSFRRLERHIRMNNFTNVKLFNVGVSDKVSQVNLIVSSRKGTNLSHLQDEDEVIDKNACKVPVNTIPPDLLVEKGELKLPDLIKVDVQGHGKEALKGSIISIEKKLPIILFSSHSKRELEGTRELLKPFGYEVFDVEGNQLGWEFFKSPWNQTAILKVIEM